MRKKIYLASPLFSDSERNVNVAICSVLEQTCDVFLPQRDGHLVSELMDGGATAKDAYRLVFRRDVEAIQRCDAIVANLDGRSVDEGVAFEIGFAHALGKMCVGYRTDIRVLLPWGLNPMVVAPLQSIYSSLTELDLWARAFSEGRQAKLSIVGR